MDLFSGFPISAPPIEVPKRVDRITVDATTENYALNFHLQSMNGASMMTENQTHHWTVVTNVVKGEPVSQMKCQRCGIAYDGGKHNEEVCPEAPK